MFIHGRRHDQVLTQANDAALTKMASRTYESHFGEGFTLFVTGLSNELCKPIEHHAADNVISYRSQMHYEIDGKCMVLVGHTVDTQYIYIYYVLPMKGGGRKLYILPKLIPKFPLYCIGIVIVKVTFCLL